jgi:CSLREA domain-containing protein
VKTRLLTIPLLAILILAVALPGLAREQTPPAGNARWGMRLAAAPPRPRAGPAAQPWQAPERPCPDRVISVNTTEDELNTDGDCSLREAIEAANTNSVVDGCARGCRDDTVFVPAGTYTLTIPGPNEDANRTGDLDILDNAFIHGAGADLTILDGNNLDRVLDIHPGRTVAVNGVTVTGGHIHDWNGGGILNQGILTLNGVALRENQIISMYGYGGAGLANSALVQDATATLNDCLITENTAPLGGGIENAAWTNLRATLLLNRSTVSDNTALLCCGGGLYHGYYEGATDSVSLMILADSAIENNMSSEYGSGGGIFGIGGPLDNAGTTLTVDHCTIRNNHVTTSASGNGVGGGLYTWATTTTVLASTISGNTATCASLDSCGAGGGILARESTTMVLDSTISHNTASGTGFGSLGGGVFLLTGAATFANSTISGNQVSGAGIPDASGLGGGIAAGDYFGAMALSLTNTTVAGNGSNVAGGGIAAVQWGAGTTITFTNSLIDDNSAPAGTGQGCANPDIGYGTSTFTSLGYNMEDYNYCSFDQPTDLPSTDALLYPLAGNGGDTQTHALLRGSPAIDQGSCPGLTGDQRGLPRPVDIPGIPDADDGCDIGAYELQSLSLIALTKSVGTDPAACAATDTVILPPGGGEVTYCYQVENSGNVTLTLHELLDDRLGQLLDQPYELQPGETWWLTATATITETTMNRATWTAYNPGPTDVVSATDTATVHVPLPYGVYLPLVARSGP